MSKNTVLQRDNRQRAKVELSTLLLEKLITSGLLNASECKCLDNAAKKVVWQSLLSSSASMEQPTW